MNLLMLSLTMIIVLVLAIYAMTRGQAIENEIQRLVTTKPLEQIYDEYRSNNFTLNLYVAGGILLTGAFALIFFGAGGLDPRLWGLVNWIFAVIGMTATVAITLGQRSLYSSVRQNTAALLVTLLILTFVIFSEVATSSEREDSLVRDRSLNSPTLNAVLGKITNPDPLPHSRASHYYAEAARFASLANNCTGQCKRANQAQADKHTVQAQYEDSRFNTALAAQRQAKTDLIDHSQNLEYVETNHTAVVRWIKEVSASTWAAAMMFASLVFVVAFESGFHFTGTRNGIYIEALSRLGYSVRRRTKRPTLYPKQTELPETPETRSPKQVTGTNADTSNMHDMDKTDPNRQQELDDMALFYQNAKGATVGELLTCPTCAERFRKKTYNQCFCASGCRDTFWNLTKPERLQAARGA